MDGVGAICLSNDERRPCTTEQFSVQYGRSVSNSSYREGLNNGIYKFSNSPNVIPFESTAEDVKIPLDMLVSW